MFGCGLRLGQPHPELHGQREGGDDHGRDCKDWGFLGGRSFLWCSHGDRSTRRDGLRSRGLGFLLELNRGLGHDAGARCGCGDLGGFLFCVALDGSWNNLLGWSHRWLNWRNAGRGRHGRGGSHGGRLRRSWRRDDPGRSGRRHRGTCQGGRWLRNRRHRRRFGNRGSHGGFWNGPGNWHWLWRKVDHRRLARIGGNGCSVPAGREHDSYGFLFRFSHSVFGVVRGTEDIHKIPGRCQSPRKKISRGVQMSPMVRRRVCFEPRRGTQAMRAFV